jgi:hypothetical protein
MPDR